MPCVIIRDPATGQIHGTRPLTLEERFPTGRKHCACCGCWRHLCDFAPKGRWVQSYCRTCQRMNQRKGDKPRRRPTDAERRQMKRESYARVMAKIKADPELHQAYLETARLRAWDRRRKAGIPARNYRSRNGGEDSLMLVDPKPFLKWVDAVDPVLSDSERRTVRKLRSGEHARANIAFIDRVMTRAGQNDQLAVYYPVE